MAEDEKQEQTRENAEKESQLREQEMRDRVIRLAFGADHRRLEEFCEVLRAELPAGTTAVLRGSVVTGGRWDDGAPFDCDGPGTSDLELTLVGEGLLGLYILAGFYIPGVLTKPLSDKDPDIAPRLVPLRNRLMEIVGRPVNIQAAREFVMYVRDNLFGQPYLTLTEIPADDFQAR